jgi:hypothetical protein
VLGALPALERYGSDMCRVALRLIVPSARPAQNASSYDTATVKEPSRDLVDPETEPEAR